MRDFLAALRGRLPSLPRNEALPLALLLLALASVFAFGGERSQFYRPGLHSAVSAQTLTIAGNLSAEHRFIGFRSRSLDRQGEPAYYIYNRFPIGSYALIKIATLPAGDDIPGQILAAGCSCWRASPPQPCSLTSRSRGSSATAGSRSRLRCSRSLRTTSSTTTT